MPEFNPDLLFKGVSNLPLVTAFYFQPFKEVCPIFLTSFLFLVSAQPHGGALQLYIKYLHQHALKTLILFFLQSPLTHFYVTYLLQVCLFVFFLNLVTLLIILFKQKYLGNETCAPPAAFLPQNHNLVFFISICWIYCNLCENKQQTRAIIYLFIFQSYHLSIHLLLRSDIPLHRPSV